LLSSSLSRNAELSKPSFGATSPSQPPPVPNRLVPRRRRGSLHRGPGVVSNCRWNKPVRMITRRAPINRAGAHGLITQYQVVFSTVWVSERRAVQAVSSNPAGSQERETKLRRRSALRASQWCGLCGPVPGPALFPQLVDRRYHQPRRALAVMFVPAFW
jgi:hypothetical protein